MALSPLFKAIIRPNNTYKEAADKVLDVVAPSTGTAQQQNSVQPVVNNNFDYLGKFLEGLQMSMQANATSAIKAEKDAATAANDFTYKLFKEGNLFAADQAEKAFLREQSSADKAMAFEKSERLAAQDFYERLSNSSYQRAIEDLKAAGLNPALAYAQGGSSAAMSSGASGSTASSSAPGSMSGSSAKANAASAKSADIRLMSGIIDGLVSVANNTLSSAVKLIDVFS